MALPHMAELLEFALRQVPKSALVQIAVFRDDLPPVSRSGQGASTATFHFVCSSTANASGVKIAE